MEEGKKQGENFKDDDQDDSEMSDDDPIQHHPFLLEFVNNNNLIRFSIKPRWDPLLELSSEISEIPQQVIENLLRVIYKHFSGSKRADTICLKLPSWEESKIREIEVIHLASYCFNFIAMVVHYCKFLKAKYQNLFCSFSTGDVI